jgi:hypothetical protein
MPFIEDQESYQGIDRYIGAEEMPEQEEAAFKDRLTAAYRLENTIGSMTSSEADMPGMFKTTDFNAWDSLTEDEKLDERFVDNAMMADNLNELEAVRRQTAREMKDRETLAQGGFLPSLVVAFADPINLIPVGGTAYKTYRSGASILASGTATATAAAASATLVEAELHRTQLTRTFGESAVNVTASALLGGVLGATPAGIKKLFSEKDLADVEMTMNPEDAINSGGNSAMADRSIGAAQVMDDVNIRGKFAKAATKAMGKLDPLSRTITSDARPTRVASSRLAENPLDVDRPLQASVETKIKVHDGKYFEAIEAHTNHFKAYKQNGGNLSRREFNEEVGRAVRNGSTDRFIQASADDWRAKLYNPLKDEAIDLRLLPDDVDVQTAENYLNRVWNKEKVAANLDGFIDTVSTWIDEENALKQTAKDPIDQALQGYTAAINMGRKSDNAVNSLKTRLRVVSKALSEAERAKKQDQRQLNRITQLADQVHALEGKIKEVETAALTSARDADKYLKALESGVANFPSKLANGVRSAIKARDGRAASRASKELIKAVRKIQKTDYEDVDSFDLAHQIAGRIMGTPDGMLPYDYKIGQTASGVANDSLSGPFKKRSFNIPDNMVEDFLDNDIEKLGGRYLKQMAPDVELMREFDDVEMTAVIKEIEQDYLVRIREAKTKKGAQALNKQKDSDIRDIAAMRDRIRGKYGQVDHDNIWVRSGRVARDLNYMRLLGGVVAASIPDVGRTIAAEGIVNTFRFGLKPLAKNLKSFKMAAREAKLYGVGTDALMGGRAEIIADIADYSQGGTAFERGTRAAAEKFSTVNLMNYWTGGMKQMHAVVMQTRVADDLLKGRYDKRLGQLGIDEYDAKHLTEMIRKHGKKVDDVWTFNTRDWEDQNIAAMWGAALRKESDRVIIVPGQEKPLFMSSELGKTIGQFKTFMFSATQRVLLSNIQRQDSHQIQGLLSLISVGMLSYAFKQWDAGREISDDPMTLIMEGIDRSGAMGILMEANNTIEKVSANNIGLRPLLGVSTPASRYASRSTLDSMMGPTFGLLDTLFRVGGAASDQYEWGESDTRALRRLLPGQNLSFIRQGLDKIEQSISE